MALMKAAVFVDKNRIVLDEKPIPDIGPLDALLRITTTTICGTDVHILRGEYPVAKGLIVGHEPVAGSTFRRWSRTACASMTSKPPTNCLPTNAMA